MGVLQAFLIQQRHLEDGSFTPETLDAPTARALQRYQRDFGLLESGELDRPTIDLIEAPRCGMRDQSLSLSLECRWNVATLDYAFENFTPDVPEAVARAAIGRAFQTWTAEVQIVFQEVANTQAHEISIGWRSAFDSDYDLVGADVAHADYPGNCSEVNPGGIKPLHFDGSECRWTDDPGWVRDVSLAVPVYDIETVALHEIGHLLGLRHSPIPGDVMYGAVPRRVQRALANNDSLRIQYLYQL